MEKKKKVNEELSSEDILYPETVLDYFEFKRLKKLKTEEPLGDNELKTIDLSDRLPLKVDEVKFLDSSDMPTQDGEEVEVADLLDMPPIEGEE